ncbi:hypothetical protein YC2023_116616 [Brassica napus]
MNIQYMFYEVSVTLIKENKREEVTLKKKEKWIEKTINQKYTCLFRKAGQSLEKRFSSHAATSASQRKEIVPRQRLLPAPQLTYGLFWASTNGPWLFCDYPKSPNISKHLNGEEEKYQHRRRSMIKFCESKQTNTAHQPPTLTRSVSNAH